MTEPTNDQGSAPSPNTPRARRGLGDIAAGGGNYLKADAIPPKGKDFRVAEVGWELNFAKDAEIPCLTLDDGTEEGTKLKVTTKGNANALLQAGVVSADLHEAVGLSLFLQRVRVQSRDGTTKDSVQIAQIDTADGTTLYPK